MAICQWQLSIVELRIRTAAFKERPFFPGQNIDCPTGKVKGS